MKKIKIGKNTIKLAIVLILAICSLLILADKQLIFNKLIVEWSNEIELTYTQIINLVGLGVSIFWMIVMVKVVNFKK